MEAIIYLKTSFLPSFLHLAVIAFPNDHALSQGGDTEQVWSRPGACLWHPHRLVSEAEQKAKLPTYWVGQKICPGFSGRWYGKPEQTFQPTQYQRRREKDLVQSLYSILGSKDFLIKKTFRALCMTPSAGWPGGPEWLQADLDTTAVHVLIWPAFAGLSLTCHVLSRHWCPWCIK